VRTCTIETRGKGVISGKGYTRDQATEALLGGGRVTVIVLHRDGYGVAE
jgi:hypothetical protein